MSDQERVTCPDCGRADVLVNRDGSLRKHGCAVIDSPVEHVNNEPAVELDPGPAQSVVEPADLPPLPERPVTVEAAPTTTTTAAPPRVVTTTRRRYCRVPNCGRSPRDNGLCASHRLHYGLAD